MEPCFSNEHAQTHWIGLPQLVNELFLQNF